MGAFICNDINFYVRADLCSSSDEGEDLWIEVVNKFSKDILCCIMYRHPNPNLETSLNKLFSYIN